MDEELLNEFLVESNENMAEIEQQLMALEANPDDASLLDAIFRTVHTVKGSCGFIGLTRLQEVAHAGEDLLGKMRATRFRATPEVVSLLLECADAIQTILDALETCGAEPEVDNGELIARLRRAAEEIAGAPEDAGDTAADNTDETGDPAWLEGADKAATELLARAGATAPQAVLDLGFDGLKKLGMAPAAALKLLGMAKQHAGKTEPRPAGKQPPAPKAESAPEAPATANARPAPNDAAPPGPPEPAPQAGPAAQPATAPPVAKAPKQESIRVSLDVLDSLMNQVGELVLTRNRLMQVVHHLGVNVLADAADGEHAAWLRNLLPISRDINHITERLQDQLLKTRMQPISTIWGTVPRVVRDMARQLGKRIRVVMEGQETELDRTILTALKDPLTHIIRNSCDHGIEMPDTRAAAGKPETGTLRLAAHQESGAIVIRISDDGAGIDAARVKDKAVEMGVIGPEAAASLSDTAALQLIFHPGLSTARKVSNISGRGVGMDVVKNAIEKAGGSVDIESAPGRGTTLNIRIPLTMAIMPAMVVGVGERRFAIPQMNVQELLAAHRDAPEWENVAGQAFFRLRGQLLPVMCLARALKNGDESGNHGSIVVINAGHRTFGLLVDEIYGAEELVVKPLGAHFRHMAFLGGCSILGDGYVIPIIECNGLAQLLNLSAEAEAAVDASLGRATHKRRDLQYIIVFRSGEARYALPMTLVERLEEIEPDRFELAGNREVLQYRGDIIPVLDWRRLAGEPDRADASGEPCSCLILADEHKRLCLRVDAIEDILETEVDIKTTSKNPLFLGTTVIEGRATEMVDVFAVLEKAEPGWFASPDDERQRPSVLFAEDAMFFRSLLIPLLESMHYEVWDAEDGEQARRLLEERGAPDLILTDLEMPRMNGYDLAAWTRAQPNLANVPIAALTAKPPKGRDPAELEAFDTILLKMDRPALVRYLQSRLGRTEATVAAQQAVQPASGERAHG